MKIYFLPLIYLFFFISAFLPYHSVCRAAEDRTAPLDFRNAKWGMTKKEVKANESGRPLTVRKISTNYTSIVAADEVIVYNQKVAEMDVQTSYFFLNNSLVGAEYSFRKTYENKNAYVGAYDKLRGVLARKYGPPVSEDKAWKDERFGKRTEIPSDPDKLNHESIWETSRSEISLSLKTVANTGYQVSQDLKQRLRILYSSKEPDYLKDF